MKEIGAQFFSLWKAAKPLQKGVALCLLFLLLSALIFNPFKKKHNDNQEFAIIESSNSNQKGFELFDTNTWIKGDKELQVLEMRALKGQLEKDIAGFEHIKSASVILDMAPPKSFGSASYKTKASVILTLKPETVLMLSEVRAITYHLAGAVHGLEPNMIAISDTTGKLYKVLDPEGEAEFISNAALLFEEQMEQKIRTLLSPLGTPFTCTVQAPFLKGEEKPTTCSIAVTVDMSHESHLEEIRRQIETMVGGYQIPVQIHVGALPFVQKGQERKEKRGYTRQLIMLGVIVAALLSLFPLFRRYQKQKEEETLFRVMTRVDIKKLAESIQGEDPHTIALMLSYLEPKRAEELIASFNDELQEAVLNHLSEWEYENN